MRGVGKLALLHLKIVAERALVGVESSSVAMVVVTLAAERSTRAHAKIAITIATANTTPTTPKMLSGTPA